MVVPKSPVDGCDMFGDSDDIKGNIPLIVRGGCMFIHKVIIIIILLLLLLLLYYCLLDS